MYSPRKQNGITSKSDIFMRPDVLHPIPKEITSIRENLEERKRTFEQCFLVQDAIIYVTYLHVFYLLCILTFLVCVCEHSKEGIAARSFVYPAAGCTCLLSIIVLVLANRASVIVALIIPLMIWQVLVALSLICGGAYLIHSITVMSFASTRLRILAWCFAPISAVLFTAFHFFAIYLTCVYYNYIRQRKNDGSKASKLKIRYESTETFDQRSYIREKNHCGSINSMLLVPACSSPIKRRTEIRVSEPINV
ncbi:unnamed protein product [Enterobius vermicularis]|uniref:Uncharacterized protein n=1 Tax=Enterobius vermicularis TaxID=51028 RepID=A0A0N4VFR2_ENTVE|nr:unnamed protein product [Enterobius vermicularis]